MADRGSDRRNEFRAFVEAQGDDLHKLALFQTLYDIKSTYIWGGWTAWEDEFQNPNSPAVRKFAEEYADRIRFLNICNLKPIASLNRLRPSLPSAG